MQTKLRYSWLVLATASTVALAGCASGTKQGNVATGDVAANSPAATSGGCTTTETLKLNVAISAPLANVGVGQTEGIFAKHCLNVEMATSTSPPPALAAVIGGSADLTFLPTPLIVNSVEKNLPIRAVAPLNSLPEDAESLPGEKVDAIGVYPAAGSTIASAKDLAGKNVSIPGRGTQLEISIAAAVKADGGDPAKINWVTLDQPTARQQLDAKKIDAAALTSPFSTQATADGYKRVVSPSLALFKPGSNTTMWVTTADTLAKKQKAMANFHDAMVEVNEFSLKNPNVWNKAFSDATKVPLDVIEKGAGLYLGTELAQSDLDDVADKMLDLGFIKATPDMSNVIVTFK